MVLSEAVPMTANGIRSEAVPMTVSGIRLTNGGGVFGLDPVSLASMTHNQVAGGLATDTSAGVISAGAVSEPTGTRPTLMVLSDYTLLGSTVLSGFVKADTRSITTIRRGTEKALALSFWNSAIDFAPKRTRSGRFTLSTTSSDRQSHDWRSQNFNDPSRATLR